MTTYKQKKGLKLASGRLLRRFLKGPSNFLRKKGEIWTPIDGGYGDPLPFLNDYMISNLGRIISYKGGFKRMVKPYYDVKNGRKRYLVVKLEKKGDKVGLYRVHRLVARHFIESYSQDLVCNHINEIKTDNRVVNIEMISNRDNIHWSHKPSVTNPHPNIHYSSNKKRYIVQITNKGLKFIKSCRTLEEAIVYKNKIYTEIYGE